MLKEKTTEKKQFTECFNGVLPLLEKCDKWYTILKTCCAKSYPVIRIRNKNIKVSSADKLIVKRNMLKKQIDEGVSEDVNQLKLIEEKIADILEVEETNKVNQFKKYCNESNSINISEMWKLKQKIWPKRQETLQTGKFNTQGKMVTNQEEIKKCYAKEFKERLRTRPTHPDFVEMQRHKDLIFKLKMENVKANKTDEWTLEELEAVFKKH